MVRHVITADEQFTLPQLAELMVGRGIKRVPIMRAGQLVGIVSRADLIATIARTPAMLVWCCVPNGQELQMANRTLGNIVRRQSPAMLPAAATVQEACRLMRDRRVGAILVTEDDGQLAGLFTGRDAVCRVAAEALDPKTTALGAVMTARPDTIGPEAHAIDALRMMQDGGYRHMPIVDGKRIVGIVSHGDFSGLERARLDEETGFWEIL